MGKKEDIFTQRNLLEALRSGLMQLDDLAVLRRNPLLPLLCRPGDSALALQQVLVAAIAELALSDDAFADDAHEILYYRYVERMTQQQLAYQLGVSVRHLRRLQENALELLAARLATRLEQASFLTVPDASPSEVSMVEVAEELASDVTSAIADEIAWLHAGGGGETADLADALARALHDVAVVAGHLEVEVAVPLSLPPCLVAVPAPVLHQTLLTTLTWAVARSAAGQTARLRVAWLNSAYEAGVTLILPKPIREGGDPDRELDVAGQLLASFGGSVTRSADLLRAEIRAPRVGTVPVLIVDDNPDARLLLQRYMAQSRFQAIVAESGDAALALAREYQVQAVVLDIMMPGIDGWSLLARLRHDPATQAVPVVISTILPQRPIAKLLGAADFLQKPISRPELLATLGRLVGSRGTGNE